MSALVQRTQPDAVHDIEVGAGMWLGILVFAISVAFVGMNGYHMSNYLIAKLTTADSGFMEITWWKIVGFGIAALEIPLGMSFITNYRLYKWNNMGVLAQFALALLVAALAAGAGIGSQSADAEARTNQITSHDTSLVSYDLQKQASIAKFEKKMLATLHIKDPQTRALAQATIKEKHLIEMSKITATTSNKQANKPLKVVEDGTFQLVVFALLSIVASIGAFFLSCFHATYIKQLVALIAFSLKAKAEQDWESDASNFKSKDHLLSPLNKNSTGVLFKEKVPAEVIQKKSPALTQTEMDNAFKVAQKEEEKRTETVYVKCPSCDAVFDVQKDLMLPTEGNPKGELRCGNCSQIFHGVVNIVDKSEVENDIKTKPETSAPVDTTAENDTAGNSQEPVIPEKFPRNSQKIREGNQEVSFVRNSTGISQEFAENSTGISGGVNSQELSAGNSQESVRNFDFSSLVEIDGVEQKMKALEEEIDRLSNDPKSDDIRFSPTLIFKGLNVGYPRVKSVFEAKKAEGKISANKPFRIIYTGGE
ncbi:hypothetical protein EOL70_13610 [Leucothrix sargassi]|nr:hypothetical protein EOL70_13610 [Leucothrix sargassi]